MTLTQNQLIRKLSKGKFKRKSLLAMAWNSKKNKNKPPPPKTSKKDLT